MQCGARETRQDAAAPRLSSGRHPVGIHRQIRWSRLPPADPSNALNKSQHPHALAASKTQTTHSCFWSKSP